MPEPNTVAATHKKKRERSPNFPGINLGEALDRARAIYRQEGRAPAAVNAVFLHWGLSGKSSTGLVTMGAVKAFGLITSDGKEVRLTKATLDILMDEREDTTDRDRAIQKLALLPRIHQQVWEKYSGTIPSDPSLSFYLKSEHGFTENGASEFIKQFRATLAFAKLQNGTTLPDEVGERDAAEAAGKPDPLSGRSITPPAITPPKARPGMNQDSITLEAGQVVLQWPAQMSRDDYEDLKTWLDLMGRRAKRAVREEAASEPHSGGNED